MNNVVHCNRILAETRLCEKAFLRFNTINGWWISKQYSNFRQSCLLHFLLNFAYNLFYRFVDFSITFNIISLIDLYTLIFETVYFICIFRFFICFFSIVICHKDMSGVLCIEIIEMFMNCFTLSKWMSMTES